ncbi:hypothetical protein DNTS_026875 [Danionella cerebrum]|uniref:Uncharacterized protein n=1 Tax=Danionella cerebrum TaxID=2873325 RepID=A0A553QE10_9TELE|nr:hypothetical protein DNTS_026875 [Danionella translucida]
MTLKDMMSFEDIEPMEHVRSGMSPYCANAADNREASVTKSILGWGATTERDRVRGEEEEEKQRGFETLPEMAQYFSECRTLAGHSHSGTGTRGAWPSYDLQSHWSVFCTVAASFVSNAQYITSVIHTTELSDISRTPGVQKTSEEASVNAGSKLSSRTAGEMQMEVQGGV